MASATVLEQLQRQRAGLVVVRDVPAERQFVVDLYSRISDDQEDESTGDRGAGVRRQLRVCQPLADGRGWQVRVAREDNDLSAFKEGVIRPEFEEMLDDLEAGLIDGIVCYNLDRLVRRPTDLERLIKIYDEAKHKGRELVFASAEGDLNLSSDDGITMARVMVAFANKASRDTARRVKLKHAETRDAGLPVGGVRPFGWDWVVDASGRRAHVVNEPEAAAIRDAVERLTSGQVTWHALVREWNDLGLTSTRGRHWSNQTIKQVIKNPRLAGWRVYKGQIAVHTVTGELVRGNWEPIITDEQYEALILAVSKTERGASPQAGNRRYLLSGIVRCALCGAKLAGNRRTDVHFYYACRANGGTHTERGCGKVSVSGYELDRMIEDLVLPRIVEASEGAPDQQERPHARRLIEIRDLKAELLTALRENRLTSIDVFPQVTELEAEAERLRSEQVEWRRAQAGRQRAAGVTEQAWRSGEITLDQKRAHIAEELEAIYVGPVTKRGRYFDPARVQPPVWRRRGSAGASDEPARPEPERSPAPA